jgi:aldose 1-epimerase
MRPVDEYGELRLRSPDGALEATILTSLGMVVSSLRLGERELLALRGGPKAYAERGATFGIPILHPWANRLSAWNYEAGGKRVELEQCSPVVHRDSDTGLPMHGVIAAARDWSVRTAEVDRLTAELEFGADEDRLAAFPFPHRVRYEACLGDASLELALTVLPSGHDPVPIAFGFHPYLDLTDPPREGWEVELPVLRRTVLDGGIPTGEHQIIEPGELDGVLGERSFDDGFDRLEGERPRFTARHPGGSRAIVFLEGFPCSQVYAPEGKPLVCFEPMTAPVDALRSGADLRFAQPGGTFTARFRVEVGDRR